MNLRNISQLSINIHYKCLPICSKLNPWTLLNIWSKSEFNFFKNDMHFFKGYKKGKGLSDNFMPNSDLNDRHFVDFLCLIQLYHKKTVQFSITGACDLTFIMWYRILVTFAMSSNWFFFNYSAFFNFNLWLPSSSNFSLRYHF